MAASKPTKRRRFRARRPRTWMRLINEVVLAAGFLLALAFAVVWFEGYNPRTFTGYVRVIDGDTVMMGGERLRLAGIDAPEMKQKCMLNGAPWSCGVAARSALQARVSRGDTACISGGFDRYDRWLVTCTRDGVELNGWLVDEGWAVNYRGYGAQEAKAREAKRGIWASNFERPVEWRRAQKADVSGLSYGMITLFSRWFATARNWLKDKTG